MADQTIRAAERRWRETGAPEDAAAYLRLLERAGALPDQVPVEVPTTAPPITVEPQGPNATAIGIPGVGNVLVSYSTAVAAQVEDGRTVWCPSAAYSRASRKHVRDWLGNLEALEEVSEAFLVDLLRLVPLSEFWPTCDGCFERRQELARHDGLDLCPACARQCEGCQTRAAEEWFEHDTIPGEWLCQECHAQAAVVEPPIVCSRCGADDEPEGATSCGECGTRFCRRCDTYGPSAHPGEHQCPWEVEARDGFWYVVHATKRAKRIGPVGGPKGNGRGTNYHDRAIEERQRRNERHRVWLESQAIAKAEGHAG